MSIDTGNECGLIDDDRVVVADIDVDEANKTSNHDNNNNESMYKQVEARTVTTRKKLETRAREMNNFHKFGDTHTCWKRCTKGLT